MSIEFKDMDGNIVNVGDYLIPIEGRKVKVISRGEIAEYSEEVLFGQQVDDMAAFAILTAENLALQFKKVGESESSSESDEIINILMGEA